MLLLFTLVLFNLRFTLMLFPGGNFVAATPTPIGNIAKPGCQTQCGNLTVEYPFGIGKGCSLDESFRLICDNLSSNPPRLFIRSENNEMKNEILSMSGHEMKISNSIAYRCYGSYGDVTSERIAWTSLENSPFTFSQKNKFTVIGCDDYALITAKNEVDYTSGCLGFCSKASDMPNVTCSSGNGCCQTSIPKGLKYIEVGLSSFYNHTEVVSFNPCGFTFIGAEESFHFSGVQDLSNMDLDVKINKILPIVIDWVIGGSGSGNCTHATECKGNSFCKEEETGGYRCSCKEGYQGNPYLDPGCEGEVLKFAQVW